MRNSSIRSVVFVVSITVPVVGTWANAAAQGDATTDSAIETVASGLTNPRGFSWGPDGTLYLALAGTGGDMHIPAFEGFTADIGLTSSIATVADGCATPIVQGLVSFLWEEAGWTGARWMSHSSATSRTPS